MQYVYVLNMHGEPLMPCSPRKARLLLKKGKALVVKRTPFLTYSHSSRNGILPLHCEIVLQRNRWLTQSYVPPQWTMPCPHEIY